jgi:protein TonB
VRTAVFEMLIESHPTRNGKRLFGVGLASLIAHAAVITGAIVATMNMGQSNTGVRVDTAMVYLAQQQQQQQKPPEQQPLALDMSLRGFQTVVAPTEIPSDIPPVNLQERFNPEDYSGTGVEGGVASGVAPSDAVYLEAVVQEKPSVLSAPLPPYPELLRQAGIHGRVLMEAIIDTSGRAEPRSIKILQSPNPAFDQPSRTWMLQALFRPARVRGRAVRVLVEVPLEYRITGLGGV